MSDIKIKDQLLDIPDDVDSDGFSDDPSEDDAYDGYVDLENFFRITAAIFENSTRRNAAPADLANGDNNEDKIMVNGHYDVKAANKIEREVVQVVESDSSVAEDTESEGDDEEATDSGENSDNEDSDDTEDEDKSDDDDKDGDTSGNISESDDSDDDAEEDDDDDDDDEEEDDDDDNGSNDDEVEPPNGNRGGEVNAMAIAIKDPVADELNELYAARVPYFRTEEEVELNYFNTPAGMFLDVVRQRNAKRYLLNDGYIQDLLENEPNIPRETANQIKRAFDKELPNTKIERLEKEMELFHKEMFEMAREMKKNKYANKGNA